MKKINIVLVLLMVMFSFNGVLNAQSVLDRETAEVKAAIEDGGTYLLDGIHSVSSIKVLDDDFVEITHDIHDKIREDFVKGNSGYVIPVDLKYGEDLLELIQSLYEMIPSLYVASFLSTAIFPASVEQILVQYNYVAYYITEAEKVGWETSELLDEAEFILTEMDMNYKMFCNSKENGKEKSKRRILRSTECRQIIR